MKKGELSAREYHGETSYIRNHIPGHRLDFDKYPLPFKPHASQGKIELDSRFPQHEIGFLELIQEGQPPREFDFKALSQVLFLSYGVGFHKPGSPLGFRTVPSAGGLYPCHLYVSLDQIHGIETGVYYFDPIGFCLVPLSGPGQNLDKNLEDFGILETNTLVPGNPRISFMITASFYTSAWKYRQRAYRYMLLDAGHLVENLDLALKLYGVAHSVLYDFSDQALSGILGLDPDQEVPLVCVSAGRDTSVPDHDPPWCWPGENPPVPVQYEILSQIHRAGRTIAPERDLTQPDITPKQPLTFQDLFQDKGQPGPGFVDSVLHRRSRRNFVQQTMAVPQRTALFARIFSNLFVDPGTLGGQGRDSNIQDQATRAGKFLTLGMVCQNLEGLADGFYIFSQDFSRLDLMKTGNQAPALARVCLDQEWIGFANINFLFMANLEELEKALGPRGYRYIMFNAGRIGQRIYLAAQDLGLGCCGIGALYDGEAKALLDLNEESALVYGVAAGLVKKMHGQTTMIR